MKGLVGTRVALAAVVVALGLAVACGGGGGGGGNDNDTTGDPTATPVTTTTNGPAQTPTPAGTSTPGGGTAVDATATEPGLTPDGTPTAIATPTGGTAGTVTLDITTGTALFGFQFTVTYPTAKGGFAGSANHVSCTTPSREIFTKNDHDDGRLILSLANPRVLAFPVQIECRFDLVGGQALAPADLAITETEVTDETGEVGDPATLAVAVGVS